MTVNHSAGLSSFALRRQWEQQKKAEQLEVSGSVLVLFFGQIAVKIIEHCHLTVLYDPMDTDNRSASLLRFP